MLQELTERMVQLVQQAHQEQMEQTVLMELTGLLEQQVLQVLTA